MSRTIKAIERHMALPVRVGPQQKILSAPSKSRPGEFRFQGGNSTFFGEWQEQGPEALPGIGVRKLRLVFGPPQSVVSAGAAG